MRVRPPAPSKYGGVPEWPKGADCKSVVFDFDGSNPSSSTNAKNGFYRSLFFCVHIERMFYFYHKSPRLSSSFPCHPPSFFPGAKKAFPPAWKERFSFGLGWACALLFRQIVFQIQDGLPIPLQPQTHIGLDAGQTGVGHLPELLSLGHVGDMHLHRRQGHGLQGI